MLAHGLAVQAVRASGRRGTKVGPPRTSPPRCGGRDGREHQGRRTGDARTERALSHGDDGGSLHGRLSRESRPRRPTLSPMRNSRSFPPRVDFVGLNVYAPVSTWWRAGRGAPGFTPVPVPVVASPHGLFVAPAGPEALYWAPRHAARLWQVKEHLHHRERRVWRRTSRSPTARSTTSIA